MVFYTSIIGNIMRFARCKTPKKKLEFFSQATQAKPFSFLQNKTTHVPPGGKTQMENANKPCCEKPFFFLAFHQGCMYNRHIGIILLEQNRCAMAWEGFA